MLISSLKYTLYVGFSDMYEVRDDNEGSPQLTQDWSHFNMLNGSHGWDGNVGNINITRDTLL